MQSVWFAGRHTLQSPFDGVEVCEVTGFSGATGESVSDIDNKTTVVRPYTKQQSHHSQLGASLVITSVTNLGEHVIAAEVINQPRLCSQGCSMLHLIFAVCRRLWSAI